MSETKTRLISAAVEYYFYDHQRPRKMRRTESINRTSTVEHEHGTSCATSTSTRTSMSTSRHTSCDDSTRKVKRADRKSSIELSPSNGCSSSNGVEHPNDDTASKNSDLILKLTSPDLKQGSFDSATSNSTSSPSSLSDLDPGQCASDMSPDTYLQQLFNQTMPFQPRVRPTLEVSSLCCANSDQPFIPPITEEEQANYDSRVVSAVREGDIDTVRSIHSNGGSLSCCNRFGESLLHMACRRGYESIVLFLVQKADVSVRITDDCGRTPLHDALWNRECQYAIMDLLVRTDPILLLTCDKRGHTPFAYARREHWANWRQFLWDRREHMKRAFNAAEAQLFCKL